MLILALLYHGGSTGRVKWFEIANETCGNFSVLLIVLYRFYLAPKEMGQKSFLQTTGDLKIAYQLEIVHLSVKMSKSPK